MRLNFREEMVYKTIAKLGGHRGVTLSEVCASLPQLNMNERQLRPIIHSLQNKRGLITAGTGGRGKNGKLYALVEEVAAHQADWTDSAIIKKYEKYKNSGNYKKELARYVKDAKETLNKLLRAQRRRSTIRELMALEYSKDRLLNYSISDWERRNSKK